MCCGRRSICVRTGRTGGGRPYGHGVVGGRELQLRRGNVLPVPLAEGDTHIVERLGKVELLGRLTITRRILAGEREHRFPCTIWSSGLAQTGVRGSGRLRQ